MSVFFFFFLISPVCFLLPLFFWGWVREQLWWSTAAQLAKTTTVGAPGFLSLDLSVQQSWLTVQVCVPTWLLPCLRCWWMYWPAGNRSHWNPLAQERNEVSVFCPGLRPLIQKFWGEKQVHGIITSPLLTGYDVNWNGGTYFIGLT